MRPIGQGADVVTPGPVQDEGVFPGQIESKDAGGLLARYKSPDRDLALSVFGFLPELRRYS
jgi:hypothetical protein